MYVQYVYQYPLIKHMLPADTVLLLVSAFSNLEELVDMRANNERKFQIKDDLLP